MIRFIDIDKGSVYNGSKPYVFWMDNQQSVNMIYTKRICVLTDNSTITVYIPNNNIFKLLDMSKLGDTVHINSFDYKVLQSLYAIEDKTGLNKYIDHGVAYSNTSYYVHMLYIVASSENIGEFHESFFIDDEEFEIAADFYAEDESLKINLSNFGIELPESIQNAIYDTNVHEEAKDDITLNRKYKELLLNYWDIVAGRGSYKSLLNSLSWFEYGDLVKINELWKHEEWGINRLNREELNTIMNSKVRSTLNNFSKTTYIGIYLALQKYLTQNGNVVYDKLANINVGGSAGEVDLNSAQTDRLIPNNDPDKDWLFTINEQDVTIDEYEDEVDLGPGSNWIRNVIKNYKGFLGEEVPLLKDKIFKWSTEDLALKMYLVGCFYEAYFMPIHLDLIHSTVEELVFTNTIKCMNTSHLDRSDHMFSIETFDCNVKDGSIYRLQDVSVQGGYAYKGHADDSDDTAFVNIYDDSSSDDYESFRVVGIEDEYNHPMQYDEDSSDDVVNSRLKTFYLNNYTGVGVIIPFECTIEVTEEDYTGNDFINNERIVLVSDSKARYFDYHTLYAIEPYGRDMSRHYRYRINFNLLLTQEGENVITLYFSTASGRVYVKTVHVQVLGDTRCKLKVYRVKSSKSLTGLNADDYDLSKIAIYDDEFREKYVRSFNDYMFSHTRLNDEGSYYYKVFIPGAEYSLADSNNVKYNHVIAFDAKALEDPRVIEQLITNNRISVFDVAQREVSEDKKYYILISKKFYGDDKGFDIVVQNILDVLRNTAVYGNCLIRYELGFFYQHHYLEELGVGRSDNGYEYGLSLDDYTITDNDTLCVVPDMKYSNITFEDVEWIFTNASTKEYRNVEYKSILEPFVGADVKKGLTPGFYNITFRYKLDDTWNEVTLNSAFRKV